VSAIRQLDPTFCTWLIQRNTDIERFDTAEGLARAAILWTESEPGHFSPEVRARLLLAYANIAFSRPEYPRARALYGRIAAAKEFDGTRAKLDAEFQIAAVDRVTKHYDEAVKRLEKLLQRKDRLVQVEGRYHLALVLFDQEQYLDALKHLERVFAFEPSHADARILEGRVNLKIKRLERASRIKVGFLADKEYIVPGKPLRVSLQDRTLSIAGNTMAIEMYVRSDSGDEETFNLVPFADSKTQFEGQINTELGAVRKGDHTLQVLGKDRVHFDFSKPFKKAHNVQDKTVHSLTVISDSDLFASSGKILSRKEIEEQALERMLRAKLKLERKDGKDMPLRIYRPGNQIKPGNPINVRVIDVDRSTTAKKDKVTVVLATTSGDQVTFDLGETETHSGVFDAAVPTTSAPATAFATDSEQGTLPVFAISSGKHPAWVAQPDNKRPKTFSVDLNASEKLGKMKIEAGVPGRKLKQFLIQTSVDGKEFQTVGSWPSRQDVWDGKPRLVLMRSPDESHRLVGQFRQDLSIAPPGTKTITPLARPATKWTWEKGTGIAHVCAAFHMPTRKMRTFRILPKTTRGKAAYVLLVDGQPGSVVADKPGGRPARRDQNAPIEFKGVLGQGVHRIDVFVRTEAQASTGFEILGNTDKPPYMAPCPAEMFDPAKNPVMAKKFAETTAEITPAADGGSFDVAFGPGVRARVIRLLLADFETDAPAVSKIHLTAGDGRVLLPSKVDLLALKKNKVLEVVPGDRVSITYKDPRCISKDKQVQEAFLSATYANGELTAALLMGYTTDREGLRHPDYIGLRRFKSDDTICVIVNDTDADTSSKPDKVKFTARTGDGKPVELEALETENHSGVFVGKVFVVKGAPKRKSEIKVAEGEDLVFTYVDQENTDPGIPWERQATVESVVYMEPELRVSNTESTRLSDAEIAQARATKGAEDAEEEYVPSTHTLAAVRPHKADGAEAPNAVIGAPLIVELVWPTIVQTNASTAGIYAQTASGRKAYGPKLKGPFDIRVHGTIKLTGRPSDSASGTGPPGYRAFVVVGDPNATSAMDDGRFMFAVPVRLGPLPEQSYAFEAEIAAALEAKGEEKPATVVEEEEAGTLAVRGDDEIFIGFKYTNDKKETKWITRRVKIAVDPFFNVMDRSYREHVKGVYVGDSAYLRVINPARDRSDKRDKVTVSLTSASGKKRDVELMETFAHSGVFKAPVKFVYADEQVPAAEPGAVAVKYGQQVSAVYKPDAKAGPMALSIEVFKGSDGDVQPFTKRFKDPLTAVRTRLTIAEAHFELAKKHRRLGHEDLTEKHIATGKRLLEEALRDYPDTEARAQVDYLLANLSMEFAEESDEKDVKKKYFLEALSRFAGIVATYRGSSYAPKAQYKKALTLEKMGEIDRACEEYVKLSYRWPDNPLIAETIARLGQYFLRKGDALSAKAEKEADEVQQEKIRIEARQRYVTAAKVFGRLAVRFPSHKLAEKTTAISAQCYMKATEYAEAVKVFDGVISNDKATKEVRAEALYWSGDCYMNLSEGAGRRKGDEYLLGAYRKFKDLTWDYPESKWAKYARGRLAGDKLADIDSQDEESK